METTRDAISVAELTGHIKAVLEQTFPSLWVVAEISDIVRPRSGHLYFTLKGEGAQIRGVMWRTAASRLKHELVEGQEVLCFGDVEVYPPRGTYQIVIRKMEPRGVGALQLAFEKLQAKLNGEGLFSADRKRSIPTLPRRIGIVTSPSGAAVRDFLKAASNRYRGSEIVVIPSLVQGEGAAKSLVHAIRVAQRLTPKLDVLIVSRGGGSIEDLWCFNEEPVVRAIAGSVIPTVSAVGHEIDVTLSDLAADLRALTPTDAATRVLPDARMMRSEISDFRHRLNQSIRQTISGRQFAVSSLKERPILRKPMEIIEMRWRILDELDVRARRAITGNLDRSRAKTAEMAAALSALSPLSVLSRGYSVTLNASEQPISSAEDLNEGDMVETQLNRGKFKAIVTETVLD